MCACARECALRACVEGRRRATRPRGDNQDPLETAAVQDVQPGSVSGLADGAEACDTQLLSTDCRLSKYVRSLGCVVHKQAGCTCCSRCLRPHAGGLISNAPTHGIDVILRQMEGQGEVFLQRGTLLLRHGFGRSTLWPQARNTNRALLFAARCSLSLSIMQTGPWGKRVTGSERS